MAYTRLKQGAYLAIIDDDFMIEIEASNKEDARKGAAAAVQRANAGWGEEKYSTDHISICKIPVIIGCVSMI